MSFFKIYRIVLATLLVMLMATGIAFGRGLHADAAQQFPHYYPSSFQATGIIRDASVANQITIGGTRYAISPNVRVHSMTTEHDSRHTLRRNLELGFTYDQDSSGTRRLLEAWILPNGTVKLN